MPDLSRILVVEPDRNRAARLIDALKDDGWVDVTLLHDVSGLARNVAMTDPEIVLVGLDRPGREILGQVSAAADALGRPVVLFVAQSDDDLADAAMAGGLSAFVVGEMEPERIRPILKVAKARFAVMRQMREELVAAQRALENRKAIDRAKGLLIRARGISEDEAYGLLRKTAMDQNRKLIEVAEAVITTMGLLR